MPAFTSDSVRVSNRLLGEAIDVVDRSGLSDWCSARFQANLGDYRGGAQAQFTWRHLLIGLCVVACSEQPMILRDVVRTLNSLTPVQKKRIGCPAAVTERMVSRRYNALAQLMDASDYSERNRRFIAALTAEHPDDWQQRWDAEKVRREAALQHFLTRLVSGSIPDAAPDSGCYAIDATGVPSRASQRKKWTNKDAASDPDAAWRAHNSTKVPYGTKSGATRFGGKSWYGYWGHILARIPAMTAHKDGRIEFSDTPMFIAALDVTAADSDMATEAARLLDRTVAAQHAQAGTGGPPAPTPADIVIDRAYSHGYERFLEPAAAAGFTCHFDLRQDQRGLSGSVRGMLIIDGQPYSPALPATLHTINPPKFPGATRADIAAWSAQVARRAPYAIRLRRRDRATSEFHWSCPAARDFTAARCGRKPESVLLPATVPTFAPGQVSTSPDICTMQRLKVPAEGIPLWQPHQYGSAAWWASMARRARVEGAFGTLKDEATQCLRRGNLRVMGRAKTAIMAAFLVAAVNIRLARKLTATSAHPTAAPIARGPRPRTVRLAAIRAARQAAAQAGLAAASP